jgi:hypothetical protein
VSAELLLLKAGSTAGSETKSFGDAGVCANADGRTSKRESKTQNQARVRRRMKDIPLSEAVCDGLFLQRSILRDISHMGDI